MPADGRRRLPAPGWRQVVLTVAVASVHVLLLDEVARSRLGDGAGQKLPARIEVAFVRELQQAAAPVAAPPPAPAPARLPAVARAPARPASAPTPAPEAPPADDRPATEAVADSESAPAPEDASSVEPFGAAGSAPVSMSPASTPAPESAVQAQAALPADTAPSVPARPAVQADESASAVAAAASSTVAAASAAASASAVAPVAVFDWPPSTQLNFTLLGNYRGPVQGSARVEWLRDGDRYQVRMESTAGPLFRRTAISEGELGERGLAPRRFAGEQRVLFGKMRRWQLKFGRERVTLSDGREVAAMPGAQDEASQYVQLTWLFTTRPDRLRVGQSVEIPLALNRKLERWTYDIVREDVLRLPFGDVPTFHVKPRREAGGGDLTAEIWIAPTLQYLPVRILLRQSAEVWVDLTLDKPPLQAGSAR